MYGSWTIKWIPTTVSSKTDESSNHVTNVCSLSTVTWHYIFMLYAIHVVVCHTQVFFPATTQS